MEALDLRLRGLHEPRDVAPFIFLGGGDAAKREDLTFGGEYSNLTAPQYIFVSDIFMELSFHIRIPKLKKLRNRQSISDCCEC